MVTFLLKIIQVSLINESIKNVNYCLVESDNDDNISAGKVGFSGGFGLPSSSNYMGAFNSVPDRVGSAPAVDLGVVRYYSYS